MPTYLQRYLIVFFILLTLSACGSPDGPEVISERDTPTSPPNSISSNSAEVVVPDLVKLDTDAAQARAETMGLTYRAVDSKYSVTIAQKSIIEQDPPAGTTVEIGSAVEVIVSLGPEPTNTPKPSATSSTPEPSPSPTPTSTPPLAATDAPTETPTATPTTEMTPTETLTPTLAATALPTFTPTPISIPQFRDTFDGDFQPEWRKEDEKWAVVNGMLSSLTYDAEMYVGDETWSNYKVQVDAIDIGYYCHLRLMTHLVDKDLHYVNIAMYSSYIDISKKTGRFESLPQGRITDISGPYTLLVTAKGNLFTIFINNEQIYQVNLPDFSYGYTGLACSDHANFLDNFIVEPLPIEE